MKILVFSVLWLNMLVFYKIVVFPVFYIPNFYRYFVFASL